MSFRDFLDASYALIVESYLTIGPNRIDLLSAVEKVGLTKPEEKKVRVDTSPMAQLQAMMKDVKGVPRVRTVPR